MAISAGGVVATLELDASKFNQGLKTADGEMQGFVGKLDKVGGFMGKIGDTMTKRVTLPILGIATAATMVGIDFESSMSEVQAISGATGSDLEALESKAREMGATTKFSASEAADALNYMAMAGWDTNQMLDGIDGVMMLAAASGEDLATTSDIVTDALTAFGLEAGDAGDFADLLASASANANTNVGMLGESFKYVAPIFGAAGYSAEDAALALGLMGDAGIKSSQAGTTLRTSITSLVNPTGEAADLMDELGISITDSNGEMLPFIDVMRDLRSKFGELTEEQQLQYAATIFGQQGMSGMLAIINASEDDFDHLTTATREYNGAAKEMATIMEDNLQGQLTVLKSGLEEVGIQIFEALLPHLSNLLEKIQEAVTWFSNLDESTQETIVKFGLLVAVVGPVMKLLSGGIGIVTTLAPLISGLGGAAGTAGGAAGMGALATGAGKLGGLAKLGPALLNPYTVAVAGIGIAGYGVYKTLSEEVIPEVDVFADHVEVAAASFVDHNGNIRHSAETTTTTISEATKEAVGAYMDMDENLRFHTDNIYINSTEVTQEMADELKGMYGEMADSIISTAEERKDKELEVLRGLFEESHTLMTSEQNALLDEVDSYYEQKIQNTEAHEELVNKIYQNAADNNREITQEEQIQINKIQDAMRETAVRIMSEQEVEANLILERMAANDYRITAEQATAHIQELNRQRDAAIEAAEAEYEERMRVAIRLKNDGTEAGKELADKIIAEAERQRDGTLDAANETRDGAVDKIFEMNEDLIKNVDASTGEVITFWNKLRGNWDKWQPKNKTATVTTIYKTQGNVVGVAQNQVYQAFARGTNFAPGGWALVGEEGPELVELPRGSKVKTAEETKDKLGQTRGDIIQNINIHSPEPISPSEAARKYKQASQQLAMEWGV